MSYYDAMLISFSFVLFISLLGYQRDRFLAKQTKAIADMEKHEQEVREVKEKAIPENVMAIFSDGGRTFDGWVKLEDLNKLKRIYVAANQLMACNENDNVRLFAQLERAVNS